MPLRKTHAITALKIAVGTGLLAWMLGMMEWQRVWQLTRQANVWMLSGGLLSFAVAFPGLFCYRFHVLAHPLTGRFRTSAAITLIGFFFNNFLPTNVGGDGIRFLYLKRRNVNEHWEYAANILLVERAFGFLAVLLMWGIYALFTFRSLHIPDGISQSLVFQVNQSLVMGVALVLLLLAGLLLWLLRKRLRGLWHRVVKIFRNLLHAYFAVLPHRRQNALLLSFLFHAARGLGFWFFIHALGADFALADTLWILFLSTFIGFLPISIGALGTLEGAIVLSLALFGIDQTLGLSVALMYRLILILISVAGGLVFLRVPR